MSMTWVQDGPQRKAHLGMVRAFAGGDALVAHVGLCSVSVVYENGGGDVMDRDIALDRLKRGESVFYRRWMQMDEAEERRTRAARASWEEFRAANEMYDAALAAIKDGESRRASLEEMSPLYQAKSAAWRHVCAVESRNMARHQTASAA
jgi:hypothetical protein